MKLGKCANILLTTLLGVLTICMCRPAHNSKGRNGRGLCAPKMLAEYNLTFYGDWSTKFFPKNYPRFRPPAQWSKLVGRSHDNNYQLWSLGKNCSDAVQAFAENADSSMLDQDAQAYRGIFDSFTAAPIVSGMGRSAVRFLADGKHTKMSFIVKIIPSPDWFVGVDTLNLCRHGRWRRRIQMDLRPLDAGTDRGLTFTSPNWPSMPQEQVHKITNRSPNHQAGGFYYPEIDRLRRIGHIVLTKVAEYKRRGRKINSSPTDPNVVIFDSEEEEGEFIDVRTKSQNDPASSETGQRKDCTVSEWSNWSGCSQTCGFGHRMQERTVTQFPQNGGHGCPKLTNQETCGSMRRCNWKHFNLMFGNQ